jgi:hypothetical protein
MAWHLDAEVEMELGDDLCHLGNAINQLPFNVPDQFFFPFYKMNSDEPYPLVIVK